MNVARDFDNICLYVKHKLIYCSILSTSNYITKTSAQTFNLVDQKPILGLSSGRMLPLPQVKDKKPAVGAVR